MGGGTVVLPSILAEDLRLDGQAVRFSAEMEPLVRLIEDSPREQVIEKVLSEIHSGRSYRELLAAMFLAGIRNVQPRPAVGFKFHCVLVVYATHQASMAAADNQRWLPLLWSIDNFKAAQATDVREGNWTMARVNESRLPPAEKALAALSLAMEKWDVEAADAAAAAAVRVASRAQLLEVMARYATRDFRSIGHKAIYVAAAFRALEVIGWEHAEPIVRSLAYAILNHQGEDNPAQHDYAADQAGRKNQELTQQWTQAWELGKVDTSIATQIAQVTQMDSPSAAAQAALRIMQDGYHVRSVTDGLGLAAAELVMRQPSIVPLHAVTTTNAIGYLTANVADDLLRKWLTLQNVSFMAHFAEAAAARGKLADARLEQLVSDQGPERSVEEIFSDMSGDRIGAAAAIYRLAQKPENAHAIVRQARNLVFLKGNDAHDYKFSSAALEDFELLSPRWRAHYLAGCSFLFRTSNDKTTPLAERILKA